MTQKDLRVGSKFTDINGVAHVVVRFEGIFTITSEGKGEIWWVDSHMNHCKLIEY